MPEMELWEIHNEKPRRPTKTGQVHAERANKKERQWRHSGGKDGDSWGQPPVNQVRQESGGPWSCE